MYVEYGESESSIDELLLSERLDGNQVITRMTNLHLHLRPTPAKLILQF